MDKDTPEKEPLPPMNPEEWRWEVRHRLNDLDRAVTRIDSQFIEKYSHFLDMLIHRESMRTDVRKAIMEKATAGTVWALIALLATVVWSGAKAWLKEYMK